MRFALPGSLWTLALPLSLILLEACGGPELERLQGDPKSAAPLTVTSEGRDCGAVDGLKRFIAAIEEQKIEIAWVHLSRATRDALHRRAKMVGKRGVDLLRPAPKDTQKNKKNLHIRDPIATFALHGTLTMKASAPPYPPHKVADGRTIEQQILLSNAAGESRTVTMHFEGTHWRIHAPKLER